MSIDLETVRQLLSPEGERLLLEADALSGSFLERVTILRKSHSAELAGAAIELLELRKRAAKKFALADRMFFTREALEQSTGETISRYRAERFHGKSRVYDLACGIGGDAIGLASISSVTGVDSDPVRIAMAERNLELYGLSDRADFLCADVTKIPLDADAAFLDPSRRTGGKRVVSLFQLSPPMEFIVTLKSVVHDCAVKLSPATDDTELESLGAEIEFISDSGECKEAVAWFGGFKTAGKRATILPCGATMVYEVCERVAVLPNGRYIYEPDPSIIRAHMVEQLAWQIGAWKVDDQIAYLTSDQCTDTPFARGYEVIESLPFNIKAVKARLRELGSGQVIVKKRGVPFDPIEVSRQLKLDGSREFVLILTRIGGKAWAFICSLLQAG